MLKPPSNIEPRTLFETLAQERPTIDIEYRLQAAPDVALSVRAPSSTELTEIGRRGGKLLVSMCLIADGERAFPTARDVAELPGEDYEATFSAVCKALDIIGPTFGRCDANAWERYLKRGAEQSRTIAHRLGMCVDFAGWQAVPVARPERFWGIRPCDLTDGQVMAFYASRALLTRS